MRPPQFADVFAPLCDEVSIEPAMNWNLSEAEIDFSGLAPARSRTGKAVCPVPFYDLVVNSDLKVTVCGVG